MGLKAGCNQSYCMNYFPSWRWRWHILQECGFQWTSRRCTLEQISSLKNAVFWDVTQCGSCKNQRFGGTYHLHHQGDKNWRARKNVSNILQSKHVESVLTRATRRNIPEDGILHSHRREKLARGHDWRLVSSGISLLLASSVYLASIFRTEE
jgi:hypothetical protein